MDLATREAVVKERRAAVVSNPRLTPSLETIRRGILLCVYVCVCVCVCVCVAAG